MFQLRVEKAYQGFTLAVQTQIAPGRIIVLLGPSGSGKSTLLRTIAGLEQADSGYIACREQVWLDTENNINLPPQQRRTGFLFQDYALFDHLSVADNIGFGVAKSQREQRVDEWLQRLHLNEFAHKVPAQLSGGQKQRVALARALAIEPQLLLLDEPLSAIDFSLRRIIRRELRLLLKEWNKTVVLVTHDLDEAHYFADELVVMERGRIVQQGQADVVFNKPDSVAAARILGWKNSLRFDRFEDGHACGEWGRIAVENPAAIDQGVLVFCSNAANVVSSKQGSPLVGRVLHRFQEGDAFEMEVELTAATIVSVECDQQLYHDVKDGDEIGLSLKPGLSMVFPQE